MPMVNVAINGFGRIGRMILRVGIKDPKINFVAVNDLTDAKTLAHLLKYDSVHGSLGFPIESDKESVTVNGKKIKVLALKEVSDLPWKKLDIDIVVPLYSRLGPNSHDRAYLGLGPPQPGHR